MVLRRSFVLLFLLLNSVYAFRALYLASGMGYSHLEYTGKLADILVEGGHEVDYIVLDWNPTLNNNGSKKANVIRFVGKNMDKMVPLTMKLAMMSNAFENDMTFNDWLILGEFFELHCEALFTDHKLMNYMRTRNYTVGLAEDFDGCSLALFHHLGIRSTHQTIAFPLTDGIALSTGASLDFRHVPILNNYKQQGPINSWFDVLYNFYEYLLLRFYTQHLCADPVDKLTKQLFDANFPSVLDLQRRSSYVWANTFEFMDYARANSPKVKHIGGIAVKEPSLMNQDMEQILNQAKAGVVLVSFGSMVKTEYIKPAVFTQLLETFASFPDHQFVWRLTELSEEIMSKIQKYPNIHAFKWLQQTAILAHPKTVAFVSHVGVNSLNEAVYFGVPIVAVPFFGDQPIIASMVVKRGNGVFVSKRKLEMLRPALTEILHNKKYKERALDLKEKVRNMPTKPEELFLKHVEFAERFDVSRDLQLDSADDSFFEHFNLDIIGLALLLLILTAFLLFAVIRHLYRGYVLVSSLLDSKKTSAKKKN